MKIPRIFKRKRSLIVLTAVFIAGVGVTVLAWNPRSENMSSDSPAVASLEEVCAGEELKDAGCHADYLEELTNSHGPVVAFDNLKNTYETVPLVKTNCHPLTHVIGRAAAERHDDVAEAYAQGDNFCWSGYYHGVMEELISRLGEEKVTARADDICDGVADDEYSFYHYNCVHGLGHGFMLITHNELFESLGFCDVLSDEWERKSCYGGVFMENIMAGSQDATGHATEYLNADDPLYPCTSVGEKYRQQCYAMQTSHALNVAGRDFGRVFELCAGVDREYVNTCYSSLGRDASGSTTSDVDQTREICMLGGDNEARRHCFAGAVRDFISYHHDDTEAKAFCDSLAAKFSGNCHDTVREYYAAF